MNKTTFFKSWLLLLCMIVGSSAAWADKVTYTVASKTSVTTSGTAPDGSSASYSQTYSTAGQLTNGNTATLTVTNLPSNITITGITLGVHNNKTAGNGNASATMGGVEFATLSEIKGLGNSAFVDKDMEVTPTTPSGNLVITIEATANSVYIETFKITYTLGGSSLQNSDFALSSSNNLSFDLFSNKAAQTISYTTSSTGAVTVSSSEYISAVVDQTNKKITVTPLKKTPSAQTITVSQEADENYKIGSATFTVNIDDSTPQTGEWVLTDLADLTANDVFVIIGEKSNNLKTFYHALTNDNGTSGAPAAPNLDVENEKLSGNIADNIKWNISGDATNGYTFYPNGSTTTWLYCSTTASSSSNNNMRVGTGDRKVFVMDNNGILKTKDSNTVRYLSIYNDKDWRGYINTDLAPKITFYKYVDGTAASTPRISADNVNIAYDATSGSIEFTVTNPANDGVLTATTTDSWLTLGTVGPTIPFTTTANDASAERTATVTLTYTYNTSETVTKTVTITQAAAPMIYKTIPALFDAATSTATDVTISFGGWVVSAVKGNNAYLTDNQGNGLIIFASGHGFQVNDVLTGTASCKLQLYRGSAELTELTSATTGLTVTAGGTVTAQTIAINTLSGVNTGALVAYTGLIYNGTALVDGDNNAITPYNTLYSGTFENGKEYNIKGIYLQYNDTKELLPRSADDIEEVVSNTPVINADNVEIAYDATSGEIEYTITNPVDGTALNATTTATWISNIVVASDKVTFNTIANEGDADRNATITLSYQGATDKEVTVTQKHQTVDYATLPFEYDGNGLGTLPNGLTQKGLTDKYNSSPAMKFDGTDDELLLHFNERPGKLTYDIKGNSFSGGTFKVQTSADGTNYTDFKTYTELGTQSESFDNLGEDVRYIKWIYTNKVSGNVALGNIKLETYTVPVLVPSIAVSPDAVDVPASAANPGDIIEGTLDITYQNLTISDMTDFDVQFYNVDGNELTTAPSWIDVLVAEQDPSVGEGYVVSYTIDENTDAAARSAYFKIYALDDATNIVYSNLVTITQEGYVAPGTGYQYALFTGDLVEGDYIIYYDGYAMNTTEDTGRLQYETVTPDNNGVIATDKAAIVWHIAKSGEYWTIYNADADAYAAGTGAKNKAQMLADGTDDKALWTVSGTDTYEFVNKGNSAANVNANLRNNGNFGFACYATGTGGALSLYKRVTEEVTITSAGYATYCSANNLDFTNVSGLTAYEATINGTTVAFNEGDKIFAAGEGILLKGSEGTYTIPVIASATANTNNKLVGVLADTEVAAGIYVLLNTNNNPGFYKTKNAFTVGAHTAYLPAIAGARDFIGFGDDISTGISGDLRVKSDAPVYNLNGQRVNNAQKGLYIVNGRKVVIK